MLLVVLIFIVLNLVTFFFVSVHLDGWAQGLARLFIPEVCNPQYVTVKRSLIFPSYQKSGYKR